MKKWNRNALIALTAELKENVIMNYGLEDKLQKAADGFMSEGEAQGVKSKHTSAEQMGALISILIGKSDADFGTFCMMLKAANYEVWANKLEEKARELKEESGTNACNLVEGKHLQRCTCNSHFEYTYNYVIAIP